MANNRMFLVFRPTGDAVNLGSRGGFGWSDPGPGLGERIAKLFEKAMRAALNDDGISQDDFALAMEDGEGQPHVIENWDYKKDLPTSEGITSIIIDPSVPFGTPDRKKLP